MTWVEEHRAALEAYLAEAAAAVGLSHWELLLSLDEPEDEDATASVEVSDDYAIAWLRFREPVAASGPGNLRRVIMHELLHVHLWAFSQTAGLLRPRVSSDVWDVFTAMWNHVDERTTETLARVMAPLLPPLPVELAGGEAASANG